MQITERIFGSRNIGKSYTYHNKKLLITAKKNTNVQSLIVRII